MKLTDRLILISYFIFLVAFVVASQWSHQQEAQAGWQPYAFASPTPVPTVTGTPTIPWTPPTFPGDYDRDCDADGADWLLYQKQLGLKVPAYAGADGNGNGEIDAADYTIWRNNFGRVEPDCNLGLGTTLLSPTDEKNYIRIGQGDSYTLKLNLTGPRHVRVDVYTVRGEKVKNLLDADLAAGMHSVSWNGQNENGSLVASDMYIILIYENDRLSQKKKVIIQR
jgi:hypothetical protein